MARSSLRPVFAFTLIAALAGCAGVPSSSSEGGTGATVEKAEAVAVPTEEKAVDPKREAVAAESVADKPALDPTTRREERAAATAENTRLREQLNEMSRELASARAANAKLRTESRRSDNESSSGSTAATKSDAADDKLAASLKSYGALKSELAGIFAEIERLRAENAKVKDVASRADDARAALEKLERELRTEKRARADAEAAVTKLQDQLRAIARALSAAGLSVDKLAAGSESSRER